MSTLTHNLTSEKVMGVGGQGEEWYSRESLKTPQFKGTDDHLQGLSACFWFHSFSVVLLTMSSDQEVKLYIPSRGPLPMFWN